MPNIKINSFPKDIQVLNQALQELDTHTDTLRLVQKQQKLLTTQVQAIQNKREVFSTNNLKFHWTGSTLTLSWDPGYIIDKLGGTVPTVGGISPQLVANTYYWIGWSDIQKQMSFQQKAGSLAVIPGIHVVANIFTGTGGQTGVAGGGGSEPGGDGITGAKYKLF